MTTALSPSDRALLVYAAQGELEESCMAFAEQRKYRGDRVFERELLARCLAFGTALNLRAKESA
jgi:hypothetical protein